MPIRMIILCKGGGYMVILGFVIVVGVACVIYYLYTRKLFNEEREQTKQEQEEQTNIVENVKDSNC